ncbi:MerR family transcriptional regulator [Halobacillus sp. BBL2006]|uniref:MerR family transcriptional regulator n=1 Tax=Halobacillus sp. BBL2006 TaxID=1543706 RepID=UPI000541D968|nr:MerR family transcriptional regulator [Halobacillus sp. BBL2006]KHE66899.1 MerR family transcriptional regulator [Halobacillus sp. BBL2006]
MSNFLSIAEVAEHFDVSKRTIRYYEEIGLIEPPRENNRRAFSSADMTRLSLIFRGKKYGFQLDEIKDMILLFDQDPSGVKQLERTIGYGKKKMMEVDARIRELENLKAEMNEWLTKFEEEIAKRRGESS